MKPTTRSMELRRERATLVKDARALLERSETEKRDLTAEEREQYDRIDGQIEALGTRIEREERQAALEAELGERLGDPAPTEQRAGDRPTGERRELEIGRFRVAVDERSRQRGTELRQFLRGERGAAGTWDLRALQANDPAMGGYTVQPEEFVARLIQSIDDAVFVRQFGTVIPVASADSLGAPSLDADPADADWTSEIATGSEDSTMAFGKRELAPHPLAKRIKVSERLLRVSALDIEALVRQRLGYKFAVSEEKGFLTGNGANKPLGLFTASTDGISAARDVVTGSATAVTADGLIDVVYAVKEGYRNRARWVASREFVKQVRKLKASGTGEYLWQPGLGGGQPNTILDRPYHVSEFAPNTFTTGQYVAIFGDLSYYWIADSLSMRVQRLVELYAETNQVGFIGRMEVDGAPVLEEAFARVKTS